MPNQPPPLENQLQVIREEFAADLPRRMSLIKQGWTVLASGDWSGEVLNEVLLQVHNLTGAGTTFGFSEISEMARDFEIQLKSAMGETFGPDPDLVRALDLTFQALQQTIEAVTLDNTKASTADTSKR